MNKRAIVPNFITLGNLFLGFSALLLISNDRFVTACWLLVVAGILDGLDGLTARLFKSNSKFGAEIDSLVDVVSFGVAPALLVYKAFFHSFGFIGILLSFLPLCGGVLRLARYNSMPQAKYRGFKGLPIPSSAGTLVAFFIYIDAIHGGFTDKRVLFSLVIAVSLLMVSPIPYRRMPVIIIRGSRFPQLGIIFWIMVLAAFIWKPEHTLFPLMLVYLFYGQIERGLKQLGMLQSTIDEDDELSESQTVTRHTTGRRFFRRNK
ncbi:MAG: CDP-diacylglycerol--serine O-phosphatidyltransferase [Calditrichaeota bacterium]|nr:CDP-diacylglycerol--serine O-phosphatidyltransferase [Calditrichota bacterium]